LDSPTSPLEVQLFTPLTPVIAHDPTAFGAIARIGPETVAVNKIDDPRSAVAALAVTDIDGLTALTEVVDPVLAVIIE